MPFTDTYVHDVVHYNSGRCSKKSCDVSHAADSAFILSIVGVSHKLVRNMASGGLQTFVNKVKSTAREFADSLTPVLKVNFLSMK